MKYVNKYNMNKIVYKIQDKSIPDSEIIQEITGNIASVGHY